MREEEMPSRHAVEESRTVFFREAIQLLVDEGEQVLKRIRRDRALPRRIAIRIAIYAI